MIYRKCVSGLVSACLLFWSSVASGGMLEDLAKNRELISARISPTGDYLAVMKEEDEQRVVAVFTFPDMKLINVIDPPGKTEVGNYWWVNDERILTQFAVDWGNREDDVSYGELYAVNANGKKGKYLFGMRGDSDGRTASRTRVVTEEYASGRYLHPLWEDERKVLIGIQEWSRGYKSPTRVAKLDVYTGRLTEEITPPTSNASILTDHAGNVRFSYYIDDDQNTLIHQRDAESGEWRKFSSAAYGETQVEPVDVRNDGAIYVRKAEDDGPEGLYLMDPSTQEFEQLFQHDLVDIGSAFSDGLLSDYEGNVYGVFLFPDRAEQVIFDPSHPSAQVIAGLQPIFPDALINVLSTTHDFRLSVVRVYEDVRTPEYYLFDRKTNQVQLLFDAMPWIDDSQLSPMQPIQVTARDGLELHGYLTVPKGAEPKNLPLVIVPHGGPHGPRDEWGFGWENFIPASGYAMLQINYRGSGGYGQGFENAGFGEWPTKMQDDLTDAVRWAIDQGIADPERVCIFGWSYGGYAAVMSLIREPDLYKCSVAGAGVYDQDIQYTEADFADQTRWGKKYMDKVIGPDKEDRVQASPTTFVDKIKTPLLLIHGEDDERVPVEHAYALQKAMKAAGKPVPRLVELKNEPHGPRNEANILTWYSETINFIREHIGPGVPPQAG